MGSAHHFPKGSLQLQGHLMNDNPPQPWPTFHLFLPTPQPQYSGTGTVQGRALVWVSGLKVGISHSQRTPITLFPATQKAWKPELHNLTLPSPRVVQWPWRVQAASLWLA